MSRELGAALRLRDRVDLAVDDVVVKCVFARTRGIETPQPMCVGFVLREQQLGLAVEVQLKRTELRMLELDAAICALLRARLDRIGLERPSVTKPNLRQYAQVGSLGAAVFDRDLAQNFVG